YFSGRHPFCLYDRQRDPHRRRHDPQRLAPAIRPTLPCGRSQSLDPLDAGRAGRSPTRLYWAEACASRARAAFRAAIERRADPFVVTALRAEAERWLRVRRRDADLACEPSARGDAAAEPSRFSAAAEARRRLGVDLR